jgi:hypothetical protein
MMLNSGGGLLSGALKVSALCFFVLNSVSGQPQSGGAIYVGSTAVNPFLTANPTANLVAVDQFGATYKTTKGFALITGPEVAAFDGSKWQITKQQISSDGEGGWVQTGAPAKVAITGNGANKRLTLAQGSSVLDLQLSQVLHVSGQEFSFQSGGATWRLRVVPRGYEFETTVKARLGARVWSFAYTKSSVAPKVDAKGNLVLGSDIATSRAVMVGANKRIYPCSPWSVGTDALSFTCDDRALPDAAIPYVIDPATYTLNASTLSCDGWDAGTQCVLDYYPPFQDPKSFTATFDVALPLGARVDGVSIWTGASDSGGCQIQETLTTPSGVTSTSPTPDQLPWFNLHGQPVTYKYTVSGPSECHSQISDSLWLSINYTFLAPTLSFSSSFPVNLGASGTVTFTATHPAGRDAMASYFSNLQLIINDNPTYPGACAMKFYDGMVALLGDGGNVIGWVGVGSTRNVSSGACTVNATASSINYFGCNSGCTGGVSYTVSLQFLSGGRRAAYGSLLDTSGNITGWQNFGSVIVNRPPEVVSASVCRQWRRIRGRLSVSPPGMRMGGMMRK